jgi:spermidine synthase
MSRIKRSASTGLPTVNFSDHGPVRYLHLGTDWVQGSMWPDRPHEIHLDYVQRMMGWLLWVPPEDVVHLKAMQLGLGAGTLTKFCAHKLGMHTTAIEINPQVVAACRLWFKLPPDSERLQVVLGDAAEVAAHAHWRAQVDVLHVDLYDHEAAAPVLDSEAFYADCRQLLTPSGCMVVNLFGRSHSYVRSLEKISAVFGTDAVWAFKPTREGNTVVMAQRTPVVPDPEALLSRSLHIEQHWGLPASKWLRVLAPAALSHGE